MSSEDTKILEFNQYQKPDKATFIIYAGLECIVEKIDGCKNNPEYSSTALMHIQHIFMYSSTKVSEYILSGFSMSAISSFRSTENKLDVYKGKDCMKKFCESLREHAMKIVNFKIKKVTLLTKEQQESYENVKIVFVKKNLKINI